jgi:hypothetical protein
MTTLSQELTDPRTRLYPITVKHYHEMMLHGMIEEGAPFELLDGMIVRKDRSAEGEDLMTVGNAHIYAVLMLQRLGERLWRRGCNMWIQQPISIPPINEPEPDGTIVRGTIDDYAGRLPEAKDILCVIEVADASLRRDRTSKLEIYARGGIPMYFIINLPNRVVEVYTDPVRRKAIYGPPEILSPDDKITFPTGKGKGLTVTARELFPPAASPQAKRNRSAS